MPLAGRCTLHDANRWTLHACKVTLTAMVMVATTPRIPSPRYNVADGRHCWIDARLDLSLREAHGVATDSTAAFPRKQRSLMSLEGLASGFQVISSKALSCLGDKLTAHACTSISKL